MAPARSRRLRRRAGLFQKLRQLRILFGELPQQPAHLTGRFRRQLVERQRTQRIERHRQEDRRHDWLVSVFTVLVAMVGVIAGFLIGHFI